METHASQELAPQPTIFGKAPAADGDTADEPEHRQQRALISA